MSIENSKELSFRQSPPVKQRIDGLRLLKELVSYKGKDVIVDRKIPLQLLEDLALKLYGFKENAGNKLYIYVELVKFYRQKGMLQDRMILVREEVYEHLFRS